MSLNKKKMVREIGRRTRMKNRDVETVIEALVDVWTEELVSRGRIELENFIVLSVDIIKRYRKDTITNCGEILQPTPRVILRLSRKLQTQLNCMKLG